MKISISPQIYTKAEKDQLSIVSLNDDNFYYVLEGQLPKLWKLIDGKKNRHQLLKEFARVLKASEKDIAQEFFTHLDQLVELNILNEE